MKKEKIVFILFFCFVASIAFIAFTLFITDRLKYALDTENNTLSFGSTKEAVAELILPQATPSAMPYQTPTPFTPQNLPIAQKGLDQSEMMWIPAGTFMMGVMNGTLRETPLRKVLLERSFWMDRFEITNLQYATCVTATACTPPVSQRGPKGEDYFGNAPYDHYPVVHIRWADAVQYCAWAGKRLPTEAEWEYAAHAQQQNWLFPWGNMDVTAQSANYNFVVGTTVAIGSYPINISPFGVMDMAGNVQEWVADWYREPYASDDTVNPHGALMGKEKVVRGGSWRSSADGVRTTARSRIEPERANDFTGFRCAMDE